MKKNCFKGCFCSKAGFTLIELLVVVLIIGILAAVAVPQYTLAVNKSRFATLRSLGMSFVNAAKTYYVANGRWPETFSELDIDVPGDMQPVSDSVIPEKMQCVKNVDNYCCIYANTPGTTFSPGVTCGKNDSSLAFVYLLKGTAPSQTGYCAAANDVSNSLRLCNSICSGKNNTGWSVATPKGRKTGYTHYSLQ